MPRSWMARAGLRFLLALALCACASPPEPVSTRPSLLSGLATPNAFETPARWDYHPSEFGAAVEQRQPIPGGHLVVTGAGERWLLPSSGDARVAPMLAPEALVGMVQLERGGWLFVGRSGATYESRDPLGAFERTQLPDVPLARVSVAKSTLLGVTRRGALRRSDVGSPRWQDIDVTGRAVDVALLESGHGLALLVPERLLETRDFGKTWAPAAGATPIGAVALVRSPGRILVRGIAEARSYDPMSSERWTRGTAAGVAAVMEERAVRAPKTPLRPDASALASGRATFASGNYYEFVRQQEQWSLRVGSEFGALGVRAVPEFVECGALWLTGHASTLHAVCRLGDAPAGRDLRWFESADAGESWHRQPLELRGDLEQLRGGVGADGSLLLWGLCAPDAGPGCSVDGVARFSRRGADAGAAWVRERLDLPSLRGAPYGIALGADARRVLIVGARVKGSGLAVYTARVPAASNAGGGSSVAMSFSLEEVSEVAVPPSEGEPFSRLTLGALGDFSLVIRSPGQGAPLVVSFDAQGRYLGLAAAPAPSLLVGAAGLFAVAVNPRSGALWESIDGGVSWTDIGRTPRPLCDEQAKECSPEVVCWARGCVFEGTFSRVGWKGQADDGRGRLPAAPSTDAGRVAKLSTPIRCRFDEQFEWRRLPGEQLPDASQAQLGGVEWFSHYADFSDGSVGMHEAVERPELEIEHVPLFGAHPEPTRIAMTASLQVEGIVALRQEANVTRLAWRNLFEARKTHEQRLARELAVPYRATPFAARLAQPEVLSISRGGVFVRVARTTEAASAHFVEPRGQTTLPAFAWPALNRARAEMIRAGTTPLALSIVDAGAVILRQRLLDGGWQRDAIAMGLLDPGAFDVRQAFDLSYQGDRPGLHLMFLESTPSQSWWFPFEAGGEPFGAGVPVPSQLDLGAAPSSCAETARFSSPRVIAPSESGTRHPIVLTHTAEPWSGLLTDRAVLHGTPSSPCVAAFDAFVPGSDATVRALVSPEPARGSWLFRRVEGDRHFEVRRMNCQFDAGMEIPVELEQSAQP